MQYGKLSFVRSCKFLEISDKFISFMQDLIYKDIVENTNKGINVKK